MKITSSTLVALIVAGSAIPILACGKAGDEEEKQGAWRCHAADVPMGEVVRCTRAALTSDGPPGGTLDGTSGGTSDGTGGAWPPDGVLVDGPSGGTIDGVGPGGSTSDGTAPRDGIILGSADPNDEWTPYFCPAGSTHPDCPPADATNPGGSTSDGTTDDATGGGGTSDGTTGGGGASGNGGNGGGGSTSDGTAPGNNGNGNGNGNGGNTGPGGGCSDAEGPDECVYVPDLPYCPGGSTSDGTSGDGKKKTPPGQEKKNGGTEDGTTGGGKGKGGGKAHNCKKDKKGNVACESVPDCAEGTKPSTCGACVPEGESDDCVPPSAGGCWVTGGGFIDTDDGKDNFGGNAKPMKDGRIQGNWNHVDHGPAHHHAQGKPAYIVCRRVDEPGPGQPGGKKGFVMNQVYFGGPAKWDLQEGYWFDVVAKDHGEPGSVPHRKNGFMVDTYHFTIRKMDDPQKQVSGPIVYEVRGDLVGGNIQLHPPNNGHPYTPSALPSWVSYEP